MKTKLQTLYKALLIILMVLGFIQFVSYKYSTFQNKKTSEKLKRIVIEEESIDDVNNLDENNQEELEEATDGFDLLLEDNFDFVGWIKIDGTEVDYPVVKAYDYDYYLSHDFYGKESDYGCLFVKDIADIQNPSTNYVVYGHNMKNGTMFGSLKNYKDVDYYKKHSLISFTTTECEYKYAIISAFETDVLKEISDEYPYYEFYEAKNHEEYLEFYDYIKAKSYYDTGIEAEYGDKFITLSTCSSRGEDYRFVVVGKLIN